MTVSAAVKYEVRWRVTGTEQWSDLAPCSPVGEIVVEGLDRTKQYDFEVRAVSACGARSAWGSATNTVPVAPPGTITLASLQTEVATAQADADAANAELADIASDGILSPNEKPVVIRDNSVILAEQTGIDAQATAYGITTEATAYNNAVTALTNYLATLTAPKLWSDLTGNTTIVGATFRSNFANVYTTRQALLDKIYAAAKSLADAAQATGNTAVANAAAAQASANAAQTSASAANAELANIASDNIVSAAEKPTVIRDWSVISSEQAGIDAQAVSFLGAASAQQVAYDNAITTLATYLGGLNSPKMWNDKTGDTNVVGVTFRANFNSVYVTRQTLLNAIYAKAQTLANNAQGTANTANTTANTGLSLAQQHGILDPNFANGLTYWTPDAPNEGWYTESGSSSPNPNVTTYAVHAGSSVNPPNTTATQNTALRSVAFIPVTQGVLVSCSAQIRAAGAPSGRALCRISWRNASQGEIGVSEGNSITNSTGTGTSRLAPTPAPTGAVYAHVEVVAYSHTVGYFTYTAVSWSYSPTNIDEVPDGPINARTLGTRVNGGKPVIDFGESIHFNKNIDNITDGTTYLRTMQLSHAAGALTIDNATFQLAPSSGWAVASGNTSVYGQAASPTPAIGSQYWVLAVTSGGHGWANTNRVYSCNPGDSVSVGGLVYAISGVPTGVQADFYNAAGGYISSVAASTSASAWTPVKASGYVPTTAAKMYISIQLNGNGYGLFNYAWCSINDVRVAGSGAVLGNQLNAPNSLTLNLGAVRSTTALTATSAGVVSVNAFYYYMGAAQILYNAVSNAVTGLTIGSTYYIYCRDAGGVGGTKTWLATTNVNALLQTYDDIVVAGQVTIPSSGSSGGGGSGPCVCDDMWVSEALLAGDAVPGDLFDCLNLPTSGMTKFTRALASVERTSSECVRLITEHGAVWEGSTSTPFDLIEGGVEWAPRMLGRQVVTDLGVEAVVSVEHIGVRPISHIHLGGCSYAAGKSPHHRVYSHNLQYKP